MLASYWLAGFFCPPSFIQSAYFSSLNDYTMLLFCSYGQQKYVKQAMNSLAFRINCQKSRRESGTERRIMGQYQNNINATMSRIIETERSTSGKGEKPQSKHQEQNSRQNVIFVNSSQLDAPEIGSREHLANGRIPGGAPKRLLSWNLIRRTCCLGVLFIMFALREDVTLMPAMPAIFMFPDFNRPPEWPGHGHMSH